MDEMDLALKELLSSRKGAKSVRVAFDTLMQQLDADSDSDSESSSSSQQGLVPLVRSMVDWANS